MTSIEVSLPPLISRCRSAESVFLATSSGEDAHYGPVCIILTGLKVACRSQHGDDHPRQTNTQRSTATVGNIVRYIDASSQHRRRSIVAVLIAFSILVVGAEWALPGTEPAHAHDAHTLVASAVGASTSIAVDHPHASNGEASHLPDTYAEAVLPRGTITLIGLGLITAIAVMPALWRQAVLAAIRGPPRDSQTTLSGRALLARLCIARR